jgi:hypothetical protein
MLVRFKWSAVKQSSWHEIVLRFALGGFATVVAGLVAKYYGPAIGGLFLAFPAIFCASATLIEKHERDRKRQAGLEGYRRGTDAAALDAAGAGLGSVGLAAFGFVVWFRAPSGSVVSLALASAAWLMTSVLLWRLRSKSANIAICRAR